ncbi:hypothetical protein GE061_007754 [Apolygus lucorum]|uniref:Integrase catalytic domain-containing protein n=1 Tax=Apolygus lucorum TaxID=248454 RepID=A0A8S9WP86_APOLU|nr:hypothetical protein GE061_007754 [Apolygus lucorum]
MRAPPYFSLAITTVVDEVNKTQDGRKLKVNRQNHIPYIITDNGSVFTSHLFNAFLLTNGVNAKLLPRHYHSPNKAERVIRDVKTAITAYHGTNQCIPTHLLHHPPLTTDDEVFTRP